MSLQNRIGVDIGRRLDLEEAVEWAIDNNIHYIDIRLGNQLVEDFSDAMITDIREKSKKNNIQIGLHTLSAVNMAEKSPIVSDATDEYLSRYIDVAEALGAGWLIVHGGYHFTSDVEERFEAAIARLKRGLEYASKTDVTLLLENHNPEPEKAEVHYIPTTPPECNRFFDALPATKFGWAFNPPHANIASEGINGFIDSMNIDLCGEVRLNDNRGTYEEHLPLGEGNIDFANLFEQLEGMGYEGHYILSYSDLDSMLDGREYLLNIAAQ